MQNLSASSSVIPHPISYTDTHALIVPLEGLVNGSSPQLISSLKNVADAGLTALMPTIPYFYALLCLVPKGSNTRKLSEKPKRHIPPREPIWIVMIASETVHRTFDRGCTMLHDTWGLTYPQTVVVVLSGLNGTSA